VLSLAVLGGGIRARHAQLDTVREKEGPGGGFIELMTIVTLYGLDGEAKLSRHPGEKWSAGNVSDFARKGNVHE